mgnify:CR=1 FL=1
MWLGVVTLFPEMFYSLKDQGIVSRATLGGKNRLYCVCREAVSGKAIDGLCRYGDQFSLFKQCRCSRNIFGPVAVK